MRLSNEIINQRVRAAMQPPAQPGARRLKASPQTLESLLQKARQRQVAQPGIKTAPEQRADLRARAPLPERREL